MIIPHIEIIVTKDGEEVVRKTVRPGDYVIGCDDDCDVPVQAEEVSGRHAQLTINYDHALVEDLGTGSGTFVNGQRVTESTRLWPNQKIKVGGATVELRRLKSEASLDQSLAPQTAAVRQLMPEEFLRDKKYDIGGIVAQGGMGAILDAREATIERTVAMKVILDNPSTEDLARFVDEAKITGQLEHPNIVPVHELNVDENDQLFYTMKFVQGVTLGLVLRRLREGDADTIGKYPLGTLLTIFQKVCDALAFAHSRGVIHRDLKPDNIMIGDFGEVLLMDWGLAKRIVDCQLSIADLQPLAAVIADQSATGNRKSEMTLAGSILGTPQYMAPEQARGEVENLDARSDIFSLGAILYHILCLRPPFQGDTVEDILAQVRAGKVVPASRRTAKRKTRSSPPPKPVEADHAATLEQPPGAPLPVAGVSVEAEASDVCPHLPGGLVPASLEAVVLKAMAAEKGDRYQKVAVLQRDITAYQSGFATSAEHASLWKQVILLVKRHRGIFATAFVAWLIITALGVWFVINLRAKERRATAGEESARAAGAIAEQERVATRHALAKSQLNLAEAALREGDGPGMQAALNEVPADLRDSTWHYLLSRSDTSIARLHTGDSLITSVAADPRLPGVFAVAGYSGKIKVLNVRTGASLLEFAPGFANVNSPLRIAFSPDGERIAIGQEGKDGGIVIHNARDGQKMAGWNAPYTSRLEFSADGKSLLQLDGKNREEVLNVWDATSGQLRWTRDQLDYNPRAAFTPDGRNVLLWSAHTGLSLLNAADGTLVRQISKRKVSGFLVHPDGKMIVTAEGGNSLPIRGENLADGALVFEFHPAETAGVRFAFTADDARLITVAPMPDGRQAIQAWDSRTGALVEALLGGTGPVSDVAVHPLSGELVVAGAMARVWTVSESPAKWTFAGGGGSTVRFWGSDDRVIAPGEGFRGALLDLKSGAPAALWKPEGKGYGDPSVSADGRIAALGTPTNAADIFLLRNTPSSVQKFASVKPRYTHTRLSLSPDGARLALIMSGGKGMDLFDTVHGMKSGTLEREKADTFHDVTWLDTGRLLGAVTTNAERGSPEAEEQLVVWDAATGKKLQTLNQGTQTDVLAVAPDGKRFAEAGADKMVRIRDAGTLAVVKEFRAHDGPITALAWHPSKPVLATGSADRMTRLWDLDADRLLEELTGPVSAIRRLDFSPSGRRLACSAEDSSRIWEPATFTTKAAPAPADAAEVDLLAQLTPEIVAQTGHGWRLNGGALFSPDAKYAMLPLPGAFSGASYRVRMTLRQLRPKNTFHVSLPVGGRMVGFELDGSPANGGFTGLIKVGRKFGAQLSGVVKGFHLADAGKHELTVAVKLVGADARITATLDDQPLYEWLGPIAALERHEHWSSAPPGQIALGSYGPVWVVDAVKVTRL
jgi:serine/threonine protein kinase/WD40 repeat protein